MTFQVFISYARKDNVSPGDDPMLKGFVTFFYERLREEIKGVDAAKADLWMDTRHISDVDQFQPILTDEIDKSEIMIVVMSPNWLASANCQAEVARFAERWKAEGESGFKSRLMVVRKRPVDRKTWPAPLQGQVGMAFFSEDSVGANGLEDSYFWHGKVRDENYYLRVRDLAGRVASFTPGVPVEAKAKSVGDETKAKSLGRTVFVARPASDMRAAYDRVKHELSQRGFSVAPTQDIPVDETAVAFIDEALASSGLSVHLLGDHDGFAPAGVDPIVKLQLARAARRAAPEAPAPADARTRATTPFRRILWAPKIVETDPPQPAVERDPMQVLTTFGAALLPDDKISGQGMSKFVDYLIEVMTAEEAPKPPDPAPDASTAKPKVYLYYEREDTDFAAQVADALSLRAVEPLMAIKQGPPQIVKAQHLRRLQECDAVALCWAKTPEVNLAARSNELKDWRRLKRDKGFAYRMLVVGPPPNEDKKNSRFHFARDEIDGRIDLTEGDWGDRIDPLAPRPGPRP